MTKGRVVYKLDVKIIYKEYKVSISQLYVNNISYSINYKIEGNLICDSSVK